MPCCTRLLLLSCLALVVSGCQQDEPGTVNETSSVADTPAESQVAVAEEEEVDDSDGGFQQIDAADKDTVDDAKAPVRNPGGGDLCQERRSACVQQEQ